MRERTQRGLCVRASVCHDYSIPQDYLPRSPVSTSQLLHNVVHAGKGYQITDVNLLHRLDVPEDPNSVGPDDYYNRVWWIKAEYECDDCKYLPPLEDFFFPLDYGLHKVFEDLVCRKLQQSRLPFYAKARDCVIGFGFRSVSDVVDLM